MAMRATRFVLSTYRGNMGQQETLKVVLLRHGESEWNASKRFSGWMDINLTDKGRLQAARAGKLLKLHGYEFDEAHASVLKRAVRTLWTALHSSNQHWIPVHTSWRLNERHYGALTGLSKKDAAEQLGEEMLLQYRRGFDVQPLPMGENHPCWMGDKRQYRHLGADLPKGESLKQCMERVLQYWNEAVMPSVQSGKQVLVAAHNNVIRCMAKHLDGIADDDLAQLEIPTGTPLVYHLDPTTLKPVGARNHIGFSGVFLTDDHKAVARRKKARRSMTRQAGSARELEQLMMHHPREDEESSRHASPSWAQHREHAPSSASPPSSSSQLWQPSHHSSNDTSRSNVKKAASVDSNGPCTADLDAALKELHFREYDLNGVVEGMRIADYVRPETILAEATKLGLQPDTQHPGRFRRPPTQMQREIALYCCQ